VTKAGAIENNDSETFSSQLDQIARLEILDHAAVTMKKNERFARASLNIVKPNAVDVEEATGRRIVTRRFLRKMLVHEGNCGQSSYRHRRGFQVKGRL
jgi:hypothetical protein